MDSEEPIKNAKRRKLTNGFHINCNPKFQYAEVLEVSSQINQLESRLRGNHGWNYSEKIILSGLLAKMVAVVEARKKSNGPVTDILNNQCALYTSVAKVMQHEKQGWDKVILAAKGVKIRNPHLKPQNPIGVALAYTQALAVIEKYSTIITNAFSDIPGVKVTVGPIKKLYPLLEKLLLNGTHQMGCSAMFDIVQSLVVCDSNSSMIAVLKRFQDCDDLCVYQCGYHSYETYKEGTWVDVKVIAALARDENRFMTETQVVHEKMCLARDQMGGHEDVFDFRSLREASRLVEDAGRASADVEGASLSALKVALGIEMSLDSADGPDNDIAKPLPGYNVLPLEDYRDEGKVWFINKNFPGLQAVHKDPWIFLIQNLMTTEECHALMAKASGHMKSSCSSGALRSSGSLFLSFEETVNLQTRFARALNAPIENLETMTLVRYQKGGYFREHSDGFVGPVGPDGWETGESEQFPGCCRAATLFVYLNDVSMGGETVFLTKRPLKIKPLRGMGVVHFPTFLGTAPKPFRNDYPHTWHHGCDVVDEKWVVVQGCWNQRFPREDQGKGTDWNPHRVDAVNL